ncbi:MAG TPA: S41 family peptidase [Tepidisphaeraceae bacterium]|jgi:carboxyl-terminal processing protease|nr:S41 family peptidase [Tepidisphaeraceae bacterium]
MTFRFTRFALAVSMAVATATPVLPQWARAEVANAGEQGQQVALQEVTPKPAASVDELKQQAFTAARSGHFEKTNELLATAAKISNDPQLVQMATWAGQFESQRQEFAAERQKQYEKAVEDVHKLLDAGQADYAIDAAARAHSLATDKATFRKEKWVDDLVKRTVTRAEESEQNEQWIKALRLYSDLSSVEPASPEWKSRLKLMTRRVRLLAVYTPDQLKVLQERESKDREAADRVLRPEAAKNDPTTKPAEQLNDSFRIDWRETVKGVNKMMLSDALDEAQSNYYRDVQFRNLALGGINGLRAVATTKGLDQTFPGLADEQKRNAFIMALDESERQVNAAPADQQQLALRQTISTLVNAGRDTVGLPEEVLVSEFADGAFAELDPFSGVIWPVDVPEFTKTTQGEFQGVGIQIQNDEEGNIKVVTPIEDSPAFKAGVEAGSIITHIDGKSAKNISVNQAVKSITGPGGTKVTLTIRNDSGVVQDYTLKRDTIKVASVKGWQHLPGGGWNYFVDPEQKIAYIRLTNFSKTTSEDMDAAVDALASEGVKGIILDLRNNPGGLLTEATRVSDRFLKDGVIVSTRADRETPNPPSAIKARVERDDETKVPLVVLVNQYSASASEIVSGALKDLGRSMVVGDRTFGKGSVQMLFPLEGRNALLKLTTSHYYLPSGRCLHREENSVDWGVEPDVKVEMTPEQMRAANEARQDLDVLREINSAPAEPQQEKLNDKAEVMQEVVEEVTADATGEPKKVKRDLLSSDPQLSAALLLLRLQLNGAQL